MQMNKFIDVLLAIAILAGIATIAWWLHTL